MANLLTQEQKKRNERERWWRFTAVVLGGIMLVFLAGSMFLLPTYFLLEAKETSIDSQLQAVEGLIASKNGEEVQTVVSETQNRLAALTEYFEGHTAQDAVGTVVGTMEEGIALSSMSYTDNEDTIGMQIVGLADTRDALLAFTDRLGRSPRIENIDVPLSELAQRANISFTLSFSIMPVTEEEN